LHDDGCLIFRRIPPQCQATVTRSESV
jgi:hypothetical protein